MYIYGYRQTAGESQERNPPIGAVAENAGTAVDNREPVEAGVPMGLFAVLVVGGLLATIVAMALRQVLNVKLGFIAMTGALGLVLVLEIFGRSFEKPSFEEVLKELDWRAVFFYISLFSLVGGLEKTGILEKLATVLTPLFSKNSALGASVLYWVTIPIVGVVEHDAYILTFLYTIRDLGQQGVDKWPLWWMLVWSGTLGSNLTVAGAPALYVALNICEREEGRKVSMREFLAWSVPFTLIASGICYLFGMFIWVLHYS